MSIFSKLLGKKEEAKAAFIGNKSSMTYHMAVCPIAAKINEENVVKFNSLEEAEKAGFKACGKCFPVVKKEEVKKVEEEAETKAEEVKEKAEKKLKKIKKAEK